MEVTVGRAFTPRLSESEKLVGIGFRSWMAGYQTGDISCWEFAWATYENVLGPKKAKPVLTDLACWVRAIRDASCRSIEVYPAQCAGFCRDECMAISMVAASQHNACPAIRACAFALLESSTIDAVVDGAMSLGATLKGCDRILSATAICDAMALAHVQTSGRKH
jgi:hypothetical protein